MYEFESLEQFTKKEKDLELRFIKFGIAVCGALILGFIHLANWGEDGLAIIPLKIKTYTGIASAETYSELARICAQRGHYHCVADAYSEIARLNPSDLEVNLTLGDLERRLGRHSRALRAYDDYLKKGGADIVKAHYGRAQAFEALGEDEMALLAYEKAIHAKPDMILTTVTEAYLDLLIKKERFQKAKAVIADARKRGGKDRLFDQYSLPQ